MSYEREVLDQLLGGDLPLNVIASLFPELTRCRRAIHAMLHEGEVTLLHPAGDPVPLWRYRELQDQARFWSKGTGYRLSITDRGGERVS